MKKIVSVEEYIEEHNNWNEELVLLRTIISKTKLKETIKWNSPVYTFSGKNVLGIGAFKTYFGLRFYKGVFLEDKEKVLINAQEGKTKAMRQWRFVAITAINEALILRYINEAIAVQNNGMLIPKEKKDLSVPILLQEVLNADDVLDNAFEAFTAYKKKEFCEYISEAKREATKKRRIEKCIVLILQGIGLHDKYR